MTKVISISNFKGGVGKTTTSINIGAGLANKGKKVLLIDLDPQANLTQSLGIEDNEYSIYDTLIKETALQPLSIYTNLDLIPSSFVLIRAEMEMSSRFKKEYVLEKALTELKSKYDYIIIDCPPSLGTLTINAYVSSDLIFVPIEAEFLGFKGFKILEDAIDRLDMEIDKILITRFDSRKSLNKSIESSLRNNYKEKVFDTMIRGNISLAEAPLKGLDIFRYDNKSNGALDYQSLCNEILKEYN